MANRTCTVPGCDLPHRAHGYCNAHAARWYRTGDPGPAEIAVKPQHAGKPCRVEGCDKITTTKDARGLCMRHYKRWTVHGDPTISLTPDRLNDLSFEQRFWAHVDTSGDCWMWLGRTNEDGYGYFYGPYGLAAHRIAFQLTGGEIPKGTELDHLCHTRDTTCVYGAACPHRRCVNPSHLEPVSHRENVLRGAVSFQSGRRAPKTHCPHGHELTLENTSLTKVKYGDGVRRDCRTCSRLRYAASRRARETAIAAHRDLHPAEKTGG